MSDHTRAQSPEVGQVGALALATDSDGYVDTIPLFELGTAWEVRTRSDAIVNALADRHYPRRSIGCGRVGGPGRVLVLRSVDHQAGWITHFTKYPDDGRQSHRFDDQRRRQHRAFVAEHRAAPGVETERWGDPPRDGWLTYVDTKKIESQNPGYCFKQAGWWRDRTYAPGRRRASLIRLVYRTTSSAPATTQSDEIAAPED